MSSDPILITGAGRRGSSKHSVYAANKAAMDNLTLSASTRLAPKVNSTTPGLDEFQHAVDYLMNSHYVTGRTLPLDSGRHLFS
jgi:dihydromonapterin reductase/dihydrofolate reductase